MSTKGYDGSGKRRLSVALACGIAFAAGSPASAGLVCFTYPLGSGYFWWQCTDDATKQVENGSGYRSGQNQFLWPTPKVRETDPPVVWPTPPSSDPGGWDTGWDSDWPDEGDDQ